MCDGIAVDSKYNRNRAERKVARIDVPLAKDVQTEEQRRHQREALQRLESLKEM